MDTTARLLELEPGPTLLALEAGEIAAAAADGGSAVADGGRLARLGPQLASALSFMALGALLTMLVLYGTGTFDQQVVVQAPAVGAPVRDTPLPVTAADLQADPAAPDSAAVAAGPDPQGDPGPDPDGGAPAAADAAAVAPSAQRADPAFVEIPAIGVSAAVIPLGTDGAGALEVPQDFAQTGWWTGGPEPGEPGAAVVVGHVDSYEGPAVFVALDQLAYDDLIRVTRTDGSAATFAVRSSVAVDKDSFPTDLVYGPTPGSELRLITCDGDFADGSYLGNLIITAELLAEDPAPTTGAVS